MKKSLRLVSFLVVILMILQSVTAFAAEDIAEEPVSYHTSENMIVTETLLNRLGIVTDSGNPTDKVLKGTFIQYVLTMLKSPLAPAEEQLFFDVPLTSSYADVVNTAYISGLITGGTDGNAGADNPITLNEAIIISIRALNATGMMPIGDNSAFSYMQAAVQLGLYDGITSSSEDIITREEALRVLFNTLNSTYMTSINGVDFSMTERTLIESYYKVYRARGVVESCSYGDIYGGNPEHTSNVVVNGKRYKYNDEEAKALLGQNVIVYYTDSLGDALDEIVYMYSQNNEILEMNIESVSSHKQGKLVYSSDADKQMDARLSTSAVTLVNGDRVNVPSAGLTLPKYGTVKLIDNDSSGSYDVIMYSVYEIAVVTAVSSADNKIYSQKGAYSIIDLTDYDAYKIYDTQGNEIGLDAITEDAILNISAKSDKSIIEITVCTDVIDITAQTVRNDTYNGRVYYYLEDDAGNEYSTVADFAAISDDNKIITNSAEPYGKKYKAALNTDGKIAVILSWEEAGIYEYGYILASQEPSGMNEAFVRMLKSDSDIVVYSVARKVRVKEGDTTSTKTAAEYVQNYTQKGVTRYKLDKDGKINAVEIPQAIGAQSGFRKDKELEEGENYSTRFDNSLSLLGGQILVNKQTVAFFLPGSEHADDELWYAAGIGTSLVGSNYYPQAESYKYDDDIFADVIVTENNIRISRSSSIMLVVDTVKSYDEKSGAEYDGLLGYVNGVKIILRFENDGINPSNRVPAYKPAEGDVIRYSTNVNGNIARIEPILDYSENKMYNYQCKSDREYAIGSNVLHAYGKMSDIYEGKYMNIIDSNDSKQEKYYYPIGSTTMIMEYDKNARNEKVKMITSNDIQTLKNNPATNTTVLLITKDSTVTTVVVYK